MLYQRRCATRPLPAPLKNSWCSAHCQGPWSECHAQLAEDPADSFLMPLRISSAEIRLLMTQVLGHALSGRTLKRLARSTGSRQKRDRPPTTPRVHKGDMSDLIEAFNWFFEEIKVTAKRQEKQRGKRSVRFRRF